MKLRAWIQASRPLSQANIAVPLVLGQALAWTMTGRFSWWAMLAVAAFGLLDQLFIVWANDWADADADRDNDAPTPFSGGSRVVPEGKLGKRELALAAVVAAALLGVLCLVLAAFGRPWSLGFWVVAALLMQAYSFRPLRLSYRGDGEILQGLGVGCVLPAFGYYVQAGELSGLSVEVLVIGFVLGYAGNVLTALPDRRADAAANKRTLAVRFGQRAARIVFVGLLALAIALVPLLGPSIDVAAIAWTCAPPALALLVFLGHLGASESDMRRTVLLVVAGGFAINLLLIGWSVALFLR